MSWEHFKAFLWLRWRLALNQFKKAGTLNFIVVMLLVWTGLVSGAVLFVVAVVAGWFTLGEAPPIAVLLVWDGLIVPFLFAWFAGLLTELQRTELLTVDRFLHLPVSASNVFVLNYMASLVSLTTAIFVPPMLGLSLALVLSRGPAMVLVFPLLAAFLLMVTALTNQFQAWIAAIVANPRRRRTLAVIATMMIVLVSQAPNLIRILSERGSGPDASGEALKEELAALDRAVAEKRIDSAEYNRERQAAVRRRQDAAQEANRRRWQDTQDWTRTLNLALPPGWLAYGAMAAAEGNVVPALLGTLGMGLIGTFSLWRSYRTTLRLYTGQLTARPTRPASEPVPARAAPKGPRRTLLERTLPGTSEHATAVALAGFVSLLRAPEAKMMLLTPVIVTIIFGAMLLNSPLEPIEPVRPLLAIAAITMVTMAMGQLMTNQFGFDRSAFRAFVLCPARRADVLLGKNLAFAPFVVVLSAFMIAALHFLCPLRLDHLLATPAQLVSLYLSYCLLANVLSIYAPLPISPGSMRPTNMKMSVFLVHLMSLFVFPFVLLPTLLPAGIEWLLAELGWIERLPVGLLLWLVGAALVVLIYRRLIAWQGGLLQRREQKILEVVTAKVQ